MLNGIIVYTKNPAMNALEIKNQKRNKMIALTISIAFHLIAATGLILVTQPELKTTVQGWFSKDKTGVVSNTRS
jgi:hypothetical protein